MKLEVIVREHRKGIRELLASRRVAPADLDDVYQHVLCAIHRGLSTFDPRRSTNPSTAVWSWIYGICARQVASYRRARCRRRGREHLRDQSELDLFEGSSEEPEACLMASREIARLHTVLDALPPRHKAFLVAHVFEGVPIADLAVRHGIPTNTAWNHLRLAREALRAAWKQTA